MGLSFCKFFCFAPFFYFFTLFLSVFRGGRSSFFSVFYNANKLLSQATNLVENLLAKEVVRHASEKQFALGLLQAAPFKVYFPRCTPYGPVIFRFLLGASYTVGRSYKLVSMEGRYSV